MWALVIRAEAREVGLPGPLPIYQVRVPNKNACFAAKVEWLLLSCVVAAWCDVGDEMRMGRIFK